MTDISKERTTKDKSRRQLSVTRLDCIYGREEMCTPA
jgi:hypothetical protein